MTKTELIYKLEKIAHKLLKEGDIEGFEAMLHALEILKMEK